MRQRFYMFRWFCTTICDEFDGLLYSSCTRHSVAFLCIVWRVHTHTLPLHSLALSFFSLGNCTSSVDVHAQPLYITQDVLQSHKSVSFYCCSWLEFWFVVDVHPLPICRSFIVWYRSFFAWWAPHRQLGWVFNQMLHHTTSNYVKTTFSNHLKSFCVKSVPIKRMHTHKSIDRRSVSSTIWTQHIPQLELSRSQAFITHKICLIPGQTQGRSSSLKNYKFGARFKTMSSQVPALSIISTSP